MSERSTPIALSLLFLPSLCLVAIRISIPPFSEALTNEPSTEILLHIIVLLIGIFLLWKYISKNDHEVLRSKAISKLSKVYKQEDKGLWDNNDSIIRKLELQAYSDIKGKKASIIRNKMHSTLGDINKESKELNLNINETRDFEISIDGIEIEQQEEKTNQPEKSFKTLLTSKIETLIKRTAQRRHDKNKENNSKSELIWDVPEPSNSIQNHEFCSKCNSINPPNTNYCSSCGSYMF
tara:strand:+ start:3064 stop:3774 length:711 start_codon:yes stop_codon:yes gene_type:complete